MPHLTTAQLFSVQFSLGILAGMLAILWSAAQRPNPRISTWLDVALVTLAGGVIGARLGFVIMEWEYFRHFPADIFDIWYGAVEWHTGLLGGFIATIIMCHWRKVPFANFSDALALAFPLGLLGAWWACRAAGCGCGAPVDPRANIPNWLTGNLPDGPTDVTLRLELQIFGMGTALVLLILVTALTLSEKLVGLRLWVMLFFGGLSIYLLGFLKGNPADKVWGWRIDQLFDMALIIFSAVVGFGIWFYKRKFRGDTVDG